jgi:predicted porin
MRKIYLPLLLAGTVCGLTSAMPAAAEIPQLRVQTGGFDIRLTAGAAAQGAVFDDNDPDTENNDGEIDLFARLNAEWTSPDGIVIGANIEQTNQQRETEALNTGEVYGFIASDYGRIEVGRQDGPADTLAFNAPVIALGQIRGDFSRYAGSQALLRAQDTRDAFKVIYLSPPISGLRGGISWSPQAEQNANATNPRARVLLDNAFEFGLQYQRPVGDWILGLSGSFATGQADAITTREDLNSWSIGTEARRGPLRIGAAYVDRGDSNRLSSDFDQWEINGGVGWIEDKWGVSGSASYTRSNDGSNRLLGLGAFYAVTPNIQVRSDVVQFRERDFGDPADEGVVAMLEVQFSI